MWVLVLSVLFFKQKTAYEMRISDWSSDVCSSDLCHGWRLPPEGARCAAAKTSASKAESTGRSVKARTERRWRSASTTGEERRVSVAGIFILAEIGRAHV